MKNKLKERKNTCMQIQHGGRGLFEDSQWRVEEYLLNTSNLRKTEVRQVFSLLLGREMEGILRMVDRYSLKS